MRVARGGFVLRAAEERRPVLQQRVDASFELENGGHRVHEEHFARRGRCHQAVLLRRRIEDDTERGIRRTGVCDVILDHITRQGFLQLVCIEILGARNEGEFILYLERRYLRLSSLPSFHFIQLMSDSDIDNGIIH